MKELSIEQKAKAYDKVREKIAVRFGSNVAEEIFSEYKESDDERIRKAIIKIIADIAGGFPFEKYGILKKDAIAWLEKQGEQKPADLPKGEDYGIDSLYHAARILEKTLGEVDGYQSDDGILEHKCAIEAVNRLYKQKPAWSEEDEKFFKTALWHISNSISNGTNTDIHCDTTDWLKILKERYTWKPSERQMKALKEACDEHWEPDGLDPLYTLYQDLKGLMEE